MSAGSSLSLFVETIMNEHEGSSIPKFGPETQSEPIPFRKILYAPTDYPSNYVPDSFLSSLRRNVNVRPHTYRVLLSNALPLTASISVLALFLTLFVLLLEGSLPSPVLSLLCFIVFISGWVWFELIAPSGDRSKALKSAILVTTCLLSLSPILRTLTRSTSSDSIYALATFLFLLSLILSPSPYKTAGHIATTTSFTSSIVLASRLPGAQDVFALLLLAVLAFSLFPIFSVRLRSQPRIYALFISVLALLPLYAMSHLAHSAKGVMAGYAIIICCVTFGGPAALLWAQRYKNEIRGPWDPAVPVIKTIVDENGS